MAKANYYTNRKKKFKRIVVDLPKALYRLFCQSNYRKDAATDSQGLRTLLSDALRKEK